jgi:hypothetical protein
VLIWIDGPADNTNHVDGLVDFKRDDVQRRTCLEKTWYIVGTQIGTQKCAAYAGEAVDAVHAVRNFLRKFSAC